MEQKEIQITLPDGSVRRFPAGVTAYQVAESISKRLAGDALVAIVDGRARDLSAPIASDAAMRIVTFDDPEGRETYWHSTSHLMAHAVQELWPEARFGVGPAIEEGFYYDIDIDGVLTPEDLPRIEEKMRELASADMPFTRRELSREEALDLFKKKGDRYKCEILEGIADGERISTYTEGSFIDLCRGPHLPSAGRIKHFKLLHISGSYWKGDAKNKQMQRIYGVSYPSKKLLDEYLRRLEEAKKRDHRKLGRELDLFSFHDIAPGAPFWHPNGMIIFRELEKLLRAELDANDYQEISTPIMVKKELWERSGHWQHYQENMFLLDVEEETFSLKPMNCPESTYIYRSKVRSYKDLPLRFSEIGRLHRNELSGALNGMFRVRQITMDDAHLFVRPDQILAEITSLLRLVNTFYGFFDFAPGYILSTKPEKAMGAPELWERAEASLAEALRVNNIDYAVHPGDGAFYGPKIDILIRDAIGRSWQLATIQLDFQMPERFELEYIDEQNIRRRPVMIHRAIFGSFERFIGILVEHFAGNFPLWLAPKQVAILPISEHHHAWCEEMFRLLKKEGFRAQVDLRSEKIGYKIRECETHKIPYMLVIGEKEVANRVVRVRKHTAGDAGEMNPEELVAMLKSERERKAH